MTLETFLNDLNYYSATQLMLHIMMTIKEEHDDRSLTFIMKHIDGIRDPTQYSFEVLYDIGMKQLSTIIHELPLRIILQSYSQSPFYNGFAICMEWMNQQRLHVNDNPLQLVTSDIEKGSTSYLYSCNSKADQNKCLLCGEQISCWVPICHSCNYRRFVIQHLHTGELIENVCYSYRDNKYYVSHQSQQYYELINYRPICEMIPNETPMIFILSSSPTPRIKQSLLDVVSLEINQNNTFYHCLKCHRKIDKKHYPLEHCGSLKCNMFLVMYRGIQCKASYCFRRHMVAIELQNDERKCVCQCRLHENMTLVKTNMVTLCKNI